MRKLLLNSSRRIKRIIVACADLTSLAIAVISSIIVSDISIVDLNLNQILRLVWIPFFSVLIFYLLGVYNSVLRYIDFSVIYLLVKAITLSLVLNFLLKFSFNLILNDYSSSYFIEESVISLTGWIFGILVVFFLVIGTRLWAHYLFSKRNTDKRVAIYGAGSAGIQLAGALRLSSEFKPVAFIDSNPSLHGTYLGGLKVLHPKKLQKLVRRNKIDEVLIAIPSVSKTILKKLLKEIEEYSIKVRILPGLAELAQGKVLVSELKEVDISDLLGRAEVEANKELLDKNIKNKVVLITGAGGSIGSEIARQVSFNGAKKLILLDANEYALYEIKNEIEATTSMDVSSVLANVTNLQRMTSVCEAFKVDTIYHSAAYKHVPLVEENPFEAVSNNIFGTKACLEAAVASNVDTFVLISTDKAVRPTNIMGATKRFAELILQSYSLVKNDKNSTRMTMVRFGNVIGSSGSAIPLFQQQIKEGGPVTVTHPEVIRYFMSIPEAAELVIQAGAMGKGGDVFVLDMGEPVKILELAERLIRLSGLELKDKNNPNGEIEIIFTGLRPGEKLYEELLIGDKVSVTQHRQILRAEEDSFSFEDLNGFISVLKIAEKEENVEDLKEVLKQAVSGFTPEEDVSDVVYLQRQKKSDL